MSRLTFLTILTGAFLCRPFLAGAQTVDSTLLTYAEKFQPERAYLQYDKSAYSPGETVWFKAYFMQGIEPLDSSKTFYVDWVDEGGTVLMHSVCPIVEAAASGQFDIPSAYSGRTIHVKGYTKWMLNFDTAFLYNKDIHIIKSASGAAAATPPKIIPLIQFFPEGGDMITGIKNKIAFKATDQWGRPVKIKGTIVSNTGVVDSLHIQHDGMGYFFLIPQAGVTYSAKWKDAKGGDHTTALPAAKETGIALQVAASGTKRYFTINRSDAATDNLKMLHLIGTMHQHPVFKAAINLTEKNTVSGTIPTENLPTGILTITIFDATWNAIAERITFINNHDYSFSSSMEVQHWGLSKRARNEIQITVPDSMEANLSIAVTDAALERDSSSNIISHLLLTSDLKGQVYNPAYYFSANSDTVAQYLDLVMLTNGWRRFKWEDVVKGKLPQITYPKDTAYLTLSGKVVGVPSSVLREGGNIVMIIKQKDSSSKMVAEDVRADGTFRDPDLIFMDTLHIYYQFAKSKTLPGADVQFMTARLPPLNYAGAAKNFMTNPFWDTTGSYRHSLLAAENEKILEGLKGKTLQTVTVQAKTKSPVQVLDEKYATGLFKGSDSYNFDLVNDVTSRGYQNIFTYLQGKVAGLQITTSGSNVSMQWRGSTPQVYLDEMPTDAGMLSSIPVSDVAYVKVFRPPFIGAIGGGSGGAIAVYTRRGSDVKSTPGKGLAGSTVAGYTPIREFYAPNYGTFNSRNEQRDVRTTLYWNPVILTSPQNHIIKLTFYNNDVSESFRIVIEGMSKDGQLTHLEQLME